MANQPTTTDRDVVPFPVKEDGEIKNITFTYPNKDLLDKKKEEYGFTSRSAFLRCMLHLGINTVEHLEPTGINQENKSDDEAVTIRELVPEGKENAVGMTAEFWDEILEDRMIDIVESDPEITREGFKIYR